jgi:hypothetical protein
MRTNAVKPAPQASLVHMGDQTVHLRTWPIQSPRRCESPRLVQSAHAACGAAGGGGRRSSGGVAADAGADEGAGSFRSGVRQAGWLWKRFGHDHTSKWKRLWVSGVLTRRQRQPLLEHDFRRCLPGACRWQRHAKQCDVKHSPQRALPRTHELTHSCTCPRLYARLLASWANTQQQKHVRAHACARTRHASTSANTTPAYMLRNWMYAPRNFPVSIVRRPPLLHGTTRCRGYHTPRQSWVTPPSCWWQWNVSGLLAAGDSIRGRLASS